MGNNTYIKFSICLSDIPKDLIYTADNGKKYINGQITERQTQGKYGETHSIALRYKASDGNWYTQYIGKGEIASFGGNGGNTPPPPAPPTARSQGNAPAYTPAPVPPADNPDDDLPF